MRIRPIEAHRTGFVLIAVLVVVAMLSFSVSTYMYWLSVETDMSVLDSRQVQCRYLAESGVALIEALSMAQSRGREVPELGNLPDLFDGISVPLGIALEDAGGAEESLEDGRFTVFVAEPREGRIEGMGPETAVRFGVSPEGARIHLNRWMQDDPESLERALLALPGSTLELVHSVMDWIDPDDDKRPQGAEVESYAELNPPIIPRNGPIESIEELLLVRGMTPEILFGEDWNRNGQLDPNEDDGVGSPPLDDEDGQLAKGWIHDLTLFSQERNVDSGGRARIDLNGDDLGLLYGSLVDEFGVALARFVIARRLFGPTTIAFDETDFTELSAPGIHWIGSVMDLVDSTVEGEWEGEKLALRSPMDSTNEEFGDLLAKALDRLTTRQEVELVGRLDLTSSSLAAMSLISSIPEELRGRILENRPTPWMVEEWGGESEVASSLADKTLSWLVRPDLLEVGALRALEAKATSRSPVVRFQSIGYSDFHRMSYRVEVVFDRGAFPGQVLEWRRLDRWGRGLDLDAREGERKELPEIGSKEE